jgi:hypothetical protein
MNTLCWVVLGWLVLSVVISIFVGLFMRAGRS